MTARAQHIPKLSYQTSRRRHPGFHGKFAQKSPTWEGSQKGKKKRKRKKILTQANVSPAKVNLVA